MRFRSSPSATSLFVALTTLASLPLLHACGGGASTDDGSLFPVDGDGGFVVDAGRADTGTSDAARDSGTDARIANRAINVTVSGLLGSGLVLQNSGGDDLAIPTNGRYSFATSLAFGDAYAVAVRTSPEVPTQACTVVGGSGTVGSAEINVVVNCVTERFTIGGTANGVLGGGLALYNNGGDTLTVTANGAFAFSQPVESGRAFVVSVATQPTSPAQTCFVAGGSGTVGSGNVTTVAVNCATNSYSVGGSVTGLDGSLTVELRETGSAPSTIDAGAYDAGTPDSGTSDSGVDAGPVTPGVQTAVLTANGTWAFPSPLVSGTRFEVTLKRQPSQPLQNCVFVRREQGDAGAPVALYTGTIEAADIRDVDIACTTRTFTVGGVANWLGGTLVVQNGTDAVTLTAPAGQYASQNFTLPTAIASGRSYTVSVPATPATPPQSCTVTNAAGTVTANNVANVVVNCTLAACASGTANCDGNLLNGCETNTETSVANCGACGSACTTTNGTPACVSGVCAVGACSAGYADCNGLAVDGCEVNTRTSTSNCGACGSVCNPANANGAACTSGACTFTTCASGFANCDNSVATGCEVDVTASLTNCGACGSVCALANATSACVASTCTLAACAAGYYNLDGNAANGCEYACTYSSAIDLPDDSFLDSNCDGIDGTITSAIFVAPGGNDANPGTKALPKQTLIAGVTAAAAQGKDVYVSGGTYTGSLTLANGVSIYGGYDVNANWARSGTPVVIVRETSPSGGNLIAAAGLNLTSPTVLDRLTIQAATTTSPGVSVYGLWCSNCVGLTVKNSSVEAGSAGNGSAGATGATGATGANGANGAAGCIDGACGGAGGSGASGVLCEAGTSNVSGRGGNGGAGTWGNTGNAGAFGTAGSGPLGTGGGGGGSAGSGGAWDDPGLPGSSGGVGGNAGTAASGSGGSGGAFVSGFWQGNGGAGGTRANNGGGGGGGGAGGGQDAWYIISTLVGTGNGGGGGGSGGCGGAGGGGGGAGGGSFGVALVSSSGATLTNTTVRAGNGGAGGAGGGGGNGGLGGNPGNGAPSGGEVGSGGNGGRGGDGGRGGHGGGGAGGPSYALYKSPNTQTITLTGTTLIAGSGGSGGTSSGSAGSAGASGQSN